MKFIQTLVITFSTFCAVNLQAESLVVCVNSSTQKITVKSNCSSTEKLVTAKNLSGLLAATPTPTPTASSAKRINLEACYQTSAKRSGSTFDGRLAVGLLCKQKSDILINDQFTSNETSGAKPVVESKRLVINNKVPNGVEYGMLASGGSNKFYSVQISAVCCPVKN